MRLEESVHSRSGDSRKRPVSCSQGRAVNVWAIRIARPPAGTRNNHPHAGFRQLSRAPRRPARSCAAKEAKMNSIIYLVGLLVIVMAILSLLGLR